MSEGAGVLICETLQHASDRGARAYAEIAGWSHNADSYSMMMMNPDGAQAKAVICGAIQDAQMSLDEIDYIQAHAAGTVADDKTEAAVLEDRIRR